MPPNPVTMAARPEAFELDPERTAIVVVDMQNDFCSENGIMARAGIDVRPIQATIPAISKVVAAARRVGSTVFYLRMEFRPDLSDLGRPGSANAVRHGLLGVGESVETPDENEGRLLIKGTWNTEIVDQLKPMPEDIIISKRRFSGFYETEFDTILRTLDVRNLVFTGCTTSICVESTLRDASFRDYRCLLLEDCTAEPIGAQLSRTNHEATVLNTEVLFGWVSDSSAFLKAFEMEVPIASP